MTKLRTLIKAAVDDAGSQQKLAEKTGLSQQGISYLLNEANTISAETAFKIDKATDGKVSKEKLRPDIFGSAA